MNVRIILAVGQCSNLQFCAIATIYTPFQAVAQFEFVAQRIRVQTRLYFPVEFHKVRVCFLASQRALLNLGTACRVTRVEAKIATVNRCSYARTRYCTYGVRTRRSARARPRMLRACSVGSVVAIDGAGAAADPRARRWRG